MGRLTKRITTKFPSRTLEGIELDSEWGLMNVYCEEEFYDIYEKLAHYEDLEEQGGLIEQKHGKWEPLDSYVCDSDCMWRCSECKVDLYFELGTPLEYEMYYCPHCGAKMDGELKELEGDKE